MASLFAGEPLKAPSYAATTSDVPQWLQDYTVDLFSQQRAVAGTPYQPYALPRIADVTAPTTAAQNLITSSSGAYQPAMQNAIAGTQGLAGQGVGTTAGLGYLQQAAGMSGSTAAQPYLNTAGQMATTNIGQYMNPYTQNVTDQIATLGARNLSENLLPAVSDQFIRAGQFGSSGMGTFGGRALRDTQEAILNQQNQALQAGYSQALGASQTDLSRQAQLASTAGQLTQAGQQNLGTIGAQTAATAQAEAQRQAQAQQQVADLAKMQQGLSIADAAALESVGTAQQQQQQRGLDVAYQDYQNQIQYPQTQINNMSTTLRGLPPTAVPTTGTQTGYSTTFTPSPLSQVAGAFATYKGLTSAKGGLIQGYAAGGSVSGGDDLHASVMADYGKYLGNTNYYDSIMSQAQPAIEQNRNAMTDMAAYHAAHAPIASPNTVPALYKQYNTLKSSLNPGAVDEASAAANAVQAKYNEGLTALNPSAVTAAADAANAMIKPYSDPATILSAYNSGAYNVAIPQSFGNAQQRQAEINRLVAAGYGTTSGPDKTVWYMKPKSVPSTGVLPSSKQAEYNTLLNNYNTLNTGYTTGLEKLAPVKSEYDALMAKYNTLNDAYTADSSKLTSQKAAYEKALKASEVPSPWGNAMPHLAHGGRVPGYAEKGYVDTENPADLVDGGQAFADQYAQGQQEYPTQQDVPMQAPSLSSYMQDPEVVAANAQRKALLKQLEASLSTAPANRDNGPTESEMWFNRAAAFLDPGKTGSFGEGLQHMSVAEAGHQAEKRKARLVNQAADLQRLQARSELAQKQFDMTKDEGRQRMIEKYLASSAKDGTSANGYDTGIPDNMKALLLSQEPADAVKTLVDMAKEQNKPSDLIRGVKFLVNNGSISASDGDKIIRKNLMPKFEMTEMTIPELGGVFQLSNAEAQDYTEKGTLPTRLAPAAPVAPSAAPVAPSTTPISQEEIAARKTRLEKQAEQANKDEETLYAMRPFATTMQRAGRTISALAKDSPNSFGYLAEPGIKGAMGSLVQEGVNTPWGSLSVNIEDSLAKLDPKMDKKVLEARRLFVQPAAEVEVGFRKISLRGEGSVSNMEGQITKHMGPELSDTPRVVQIKAGVVQIAGEKQEAIINGYDKYKAANKFGSPQEFYRSPEYNKIVDKYENKYYNFAKTVGIPVTAPDKLSGSSLLDTFKKDPRWGK